MNHNNSFEGYQDNHTLYSEHKTHY